MALSNGGVIGTDNDPSTGPKITSFTSSGTFTSDSGSSAAKYLVVAGGAGGVTQVAEAVVQVVLELQLTIVFLLMLLQVIQLQLELVVH